MAIQARTEFASALNQVCSERGIEPEVVLESIKQAILAAYRKDYGEAEENAILGEYSSKVGTVISGMIQRISGPVITVNLGKAEGIMPPAEQSHNEHYHQNQRLKFYVVGIKEGLRGEEIIVSRAAPGLLEGLFKQEVPEIASNSVQIKVIAREAGSRSKIAVSSSQLGVDPVGSCVGQKGVRVQAVINELGDERIDVIAYQDDPVEFIKAALSPAKDLQVKINAKEQSAEVIAPDDQLSLAIGKEGQNVRLAAKLTGYKIDIRGKSGLPKEVEAKEQKAKEEAKKALGVIKEEAKVPKAKKASKVKGKGTTEKSSAKGDQQTLVVSEGQAVQNQPPANDQAAAATNK